MTNPSWWSVVISVLALVFAVVSWRFSIKSNQMLLKKQTQFEMKMRMFAEMEADAACDA